MASDDEITPKRNIGADQEWTPRMERDLPLGTPLVSIQLFPRRRGGSGMSTTPASTGGSTRHSNARSARQGDTTGATHSCPVCTPWRAHGADSPAARCAPSMTPSTSETPLDPVCAIHGQRWSEHDGGRCLYCCICFRPLTVEECATDSSGQRWDVCKDDWDG